MFDQGTVRIDFSKQVGVVFGFKTTESFTAFLEFRAIIVSDAAIVSNDEGDALNELL